MINRFIKMENGIRKENGAILLFLISFSVYLITVVPNVYVGDGGELAVTPQVLTVSHPTGYPTFNLLGKLFQMSIPCGNTAYKMGIFSGLWAAISVSLIFLSIYQWMGIWWIAAITALTFNLSRVLWSQSVIAEVYTLNTFFVALFLYLSLKWYDQRSLKLLAILIFTYGLSLGNHMTMVLAFPSLAFLLINAYDLTSQQLINPLKPIKYNIFKLIILIILIIGNIAIAFVINFSIPLAIFPLFWIIFLKGVGWRTIYKQNKLSTKNISVYIALFILGFSINLYLPLRAINLTPRNAVCSLYWGDMTSFSGFFTHITGVKFQNLMFSHPINVIMGNLSNFMKHLIWQFTPISLLLLIYGGILLYRKARAKFWFLSVFIFYQLWFNINYTIMDIEVFYIPIFAALTYFLAFGLDGFLKQVRSFLFQKRRLISPSFTRAIISFLAILLPLFTFLDNFYFNDRSNYFIAYDYGVNIFNSIVGRATLLTQGWISPYILGYLQVADKARPDVTVIIEGRGKVLKKLVTGGFTLPEGYKIYSTVPLEIIGIDPFRSSIIGLVYELGFRGSPVGPPKNLWHLYREREYSLEDIRVYSDFQSRSLIAKFLYMKGESLYEEGKIKEALEYYRRASEKGADNKQVHNNLACIYFKRGYLDLAANECIAALRIDPSFQQAKHNLGNIYYKKGMYQEAMEMFESKVLQNFGSDFNRPVKAQIYLKQGNYQKAIIEYRNALLVDPQSVELHNNLGIAYQKAGDIENAIAEFKKAIEIDPNYAQSYNNLGNAYESIDEFDLAEQYYNKALEIDPEFADAYNNLGILYGKKNQMDKAIKMFELALKIKPDYKIALNNLGIAYMELGKKDQAITCWRKSLAIDPEQPKIASYLEMSEANLANPNQ